MKVFRPTLLAAALIVTLTASLAHAQNADQLPRARSPWSPAASPPA